MRLARPREVDEALARPCVPRSPVYTHVRPSACVRRVLRGLLGVVHVLLHDGGAGQQDLALLAVGHLLVGAGLDDLDVGIGEGQADGALLVDMWWGSGSRP